MRIQSAKTYLVSSVLAVLIGATILLTFSGLQKRQQAALATQNKLVASQEINTVAANIQTLLNVSMQYADFFNMLIENDPDLEQQEIDTFAQAILERNDLIDNVSLAPKGIVEYIHPLEGNEAAIGHNLLADPERRDHILKTIEIEGSVAQGPVLAVQGGWKIFNRRAVFVGEGANREFWGLSTITLDFGKILQAFDLEPEKDGYLYGMRVKKADGHNDFFWGHSDLFDEDTDAIIETIGLPGEQWELAIYPVTGWDSGYTDFEKTTILFYILTALVFLLVFNTSKHYQEVLATSRKDHLTGALNKKSLEHCARVHLKQVGKQHGFLMLDMDHFKQINDTLGHPAGDAVLKAAADRISSQLRRADRLARIGGDEFIVMITDLKDRTKLAQIAERIRTLLNQPIDWNGQAIQAGCSIGTALSGEDGDTYENLYQIADDRMYEDKKRQRESNDR
ncbi:MAG: sensor domain-containing diguanylate cyclase [Clostridia bacterium]|nr:sensor domain-containing diguanylate cyclase [Clostridia bacterium]